MSGNAEDLSLLARVRAERALAARDRAAAAADRAAAARDLARARAYLLLAHQDELTGTLLRQPGLARLREAVELAHATSRPLVVAFLDVDHLKVVNDSHGHAAGDELLREVGAALGKALRSDDVVIRYGGDEFVCGLPDAVLGDGLVRIEQVSDLLRRALPGACISFGLAALRPAESCESIIARADRDMYAARGRVRPQQPPGILALQSWLTGTEPGDSARTSS